MAKSLYKLLAQEQERKGLVLLDSDRADNVIALPTKKSQNTVILNKPSDLTVKLFFDLLREKLDPVKEVKEDQTNKEVKEDQSDRRADLMYLSVNEIKLDPARFQFKIVHGSTGSTGSLKTVTVWNSDLAGVILVWLDPQNNLTYCVNGHNRLDKAARLGVESVAVKYINCEDDKTARLIGALCNIAEGNGSIFDCAKLIKDCDLSIELLRAYGINLQGKLVDQGLYLSRLTDHLFNKVIQGDIPLNYGIYAGKIDQPLQNDFINLCMKKDDQCNIKDSQLEELTLIVNNCQSNYSQGDLFGNMSIKTNILEKAALIDYCLTELKRDKRLFSIVSQSKMIDKLEKADNAINKSNNENIASKAKIYIDLFNQFKNLSGKLSDILNHYASQYETNKDYKKECYQEVVTFLDQLSLTVI